MRARRTILIVDADLCRSRSLAEQLECNGEFSAVLCDSGAAALADLGPKTFDAVLAEHSLPDMDGRELCRRVRRNGMTVPIILLAPGDEQSDRGAASEACDHIARPFRLGTLLDRLRTHLDESGSRDHAALTVGPYSFDPAARRMRDEGGGRMVRLTEKETAILQLLHRAGRAIGRDTLLKQVWGYNDRVTTHTLETHIYRLRRKIERDPSRAELLVTEPGGYRLLT
jgi:DNA-binding response OmpR family regulator